MNFIIERQKRISELEQLWKQATGKTLREFDRAIMLKFETTSGRDSLTFAAMEIIKKGLLSRISSGTNRKIKEER